MKNGHRAFLVAAAALLLVACGGGSDGSDGLIARILVNSEPPGAHCAAGGSRIDLQYIGNGLFVVRSSAGTFDVR